MAGMRQQPGMLTPFHSWPHYSTRKLCVELRNGPDIESQFLAQQTS